MTSDPRSTQEPNAVNPLGGAGEPKPSSPGSEGGNRLLDRIRRRSFTLALDGEVQRDLEEGALHDALVQLRIQSVKTGVVETVIVIGILIAYASIPGHPGIDKIPYFALTGAAAFATLIVVVLPWQRLAKHNLILPTTYLWAFGQISAISVAIAVSGGARSDLYLIYLLLTVFMAGVSYPRAARLIITASMGVAYLATLAYLGWHVGAGTIVLRLGMLAGAAWAADALSMELLGELRFHLQATEDSRRRASLWSRVAGLGQTLPSLDEDNTLRWAVDALREIGFEAAEICAIADGGSSYEVRYSYGLPESYTSQKQPASQGMVARVTKVRQTVLVDDYMDLPDAVPQVAAGGFRTVASTPVWVEGALFGVLTGGTAQKKEISHEMVAAIELLGAYVGRGLENIRRLEREQRDARHFRSLVDSAPDAMIVMDASGLIVEANRQAYRLYGYEPPALCGMPMAKLMPSRLRGVLDQYRRSFPDGLETVEISGSSDITGLRRDGTEFPIEVVLGPIDTPEGVMAAATIRDVTERRAFERRLAHQATHDDLTGLPNRGLFIEHLESHLTRPPMDQRSGGKEGHEEAACEGVAVCFLDVDHFKYVNDSRGHTVGDELIVEVARRLSHSVGHDHLVARFGGDEFAILAPRVPDVDEALAYGWHLLACFNRPFTIDGVDCYVSASVGVTVGHSGDDAHDLLRHADAAMYHAKQKGRSRVELFDETLTAKARERLELESSLHQAIERRELSLRYQPVVSIPAGTVTGVEALLRWQRPGRGFQSPATFIPVAEESGLILPIGKWALRQAARQTAQWLADGSVGPRFSVSVNMSSRQLEHDHTIDDVEDAIESSGIPPQCLTLEITETFFIQDLPAAVKRLEGLKRLGVRLAIDDFGTGFSSLNSLSNLPIDVVKIDKSFIDSLGTRYDAVVSAVIAVADAFDLDVVAEGIEQPEQVDRLVRLGCGFGQGNLFSVPLLPDEVIILARSQD